MIHILGHNYTDAFTVGARDGKEQGRPSWSLHHVVSRPKWPNGDQRGKQRHNDVVDRVRGAEVKESSRSEPAK